MHHPSTCHLALSALFSIALSACAASTPSAPAPKERLDLAAKSNAAAAAPNFQSFTKQFVEIDLQETAKRWGATHANAYIYIPQRYHGPGKDPGDAVLTAFSNWCANVGGQLDTNSLLRQIGTLAPFYGGSGSVCALGSGESAQREAVVTWNNATVCRPNAKDEAWECRATILYVDAPDFGRFSARYEPLITKEEKNRLAAEQAVENRERAQRAREAAEIAAKERHADEWRRRAKVGDYCWVGPMKLHRDPFGPRKFLPYGKPFWFHGLIVEVRQPNVRVKFDGYTDLNFRASFGGKVREEWFRIEQVEPEDQHGIVCPRCLPEDISS